MPSHLHGNIPTMPRNPTPPVLSRNSTPSPDLLSDVKTQETQTTTQQTMQTNKKKPRKNSVDKSAEIPEQQPPQENKQEKKTESKPRGNICFHMPTLDHHALRECKFLFGFAKGRFRE